MSAEERDVELRRNLAAHVRAADHPLAAAVIAGDVELAALSEPDELLTEDQAIAALALGETVNVRRAT